MSVLSRLSRLAKLDSERLNLARKAPSTAPSATRESSVLASTLQVFRLLLVLPEMLNCLESEEVRVKGLLPESRDAFRIRVRMIEAPKLVDKTLFLFFDFMLTIFEAAGSNFSKLQIEIEVS